MSGTETVEKAPPTRATPSAPERASGLAGVALRFDTFRQLVALLGENRRYWLVPMVGTLVLLGLALAGLKAVEVVAPFLYALF